MNYDQEKTAATEFFSTCIDTLTSKAHDYAQNDDCFSNFKKIANLCDGDVEDVFLTFIAVKVARLAELLNSNKEAKNESIKDTLMDLSNYSCLMSIYRED